MWYESSFLFHCEVKRCQLDYIKKQLRNRTALNLHLPLLCCISSFCKWLIVLTVLMHLFCSYCLREQSKYDTMQFIPQWNTWVCCRWFELFTTFLLSVILFSEQPYFHSSLILLTVTEVQLQILWVGFLSHHGIHSYLSR